jgi:probable HAF family extracellular repeat protein
MNTSSLVVDVDLTTRTQLADIVVPVGFRIRVALLSILLFALAPIAYAQQYTVTELGTLGGSSTSARGINSLGEITGDSNTAGNAAVHAFLYSNGSMHDLGTLGGTTSHGAGINDLGQVTGDAYLKGDSSFHAFLYSSGSMQDLGTLGGTWSYGSGINISGEVTGATWLAGNAAISAFIYSNGTMKNLDAPGGATNNVASGNGINASGVVTGSYSVVETVNHAFLYSDGSIHNLGTLGGASSEGLAINTSNQVTGVSSNSANQTYAFLYSNGNMTSLGGLGGGASQGNAINDAGQIVGMFLSSSGDYHAFLYSNGTMIDLNDAIGSASSKYVLAYAQGINNSGQIIVNTTLDASVHNIALLLTPIHKSYASIPLGNAVNIDAIATNGHPALNGGLDGHGYALPEALLGTTLTASSTVFPLLSANTTDATWGATLKPASAYSASTLKILAVATNGNQLNQQVVVTYTDQSEKRFTQSFSDWGSAKPLSGESVAATLAYRLTPSGTEQTGPWHVYEYSFALDLTRKVAQVTFPHNRHVAILSVSLDTPSSTASPVQLASQLNSFGLSDGGPSANAGLDGHGYDYAESLIGSTTVWSGVQFQEPQIGSTGLSTVARVLHVPSGSWSKAYLLGTAYNGSQPNKSVVVSYSDGSQQTVVQSFSDWRSNQNYPNEGVALSMPYRYRPDGTQQAGPWYLYGYSIALDSTKTPVSISVPGDVKILALSLLPSTT